MIKPTNTEENMVVFAKTHDLILWLLPKVERFPRAHRFTLTDRLMNAALEVLDTLTDARYRTGRAKSERLAKADVALARVRSHLFLAHRMSWLSDGAYEHVSRQVVEVGRLLGGWQRALQKRS
ncbi:MAG: diversity-generating retroelement protein Avd [Myxococcota bacterium]